ncbi:hypothetical protein TWF970_009307 [Orbilia oligospora]|uniref:Apple domain-containing protein n=1 Tax=Orbilia oligospora TaxID=2813651 RepID=A0A7C8R384_ORBOL|nr:hypothetical protein TWF970_009307 [Orbilia oligospora]
MVNWTFTAALAVTTIFSFTAEANPHRYRHHHLRRATTPSYTLVYSGVKGVPDFDDCIDFTTLESSGTYSTVAKECASTADVPTTGAKFFAVYQTDDQKGTNFWWCGWWETAISDMADVIESYQEDGDAIYKAYGYNFTPPASSSTSSSSVKGSTSSASAKGSTSTPASVKGTASTSAKAASSTSSSVKSATSTSVSSTTPVVNTSKSDSTSAVKKYSTSGNDAKSSSTLKTTSTSSTVNASISPSGSASSSANTSPSSASSLTSGNTASSTHTGKTKLKTSSSSSTSSSTGTVSATPNVGSDLSTTPTTLAKKASSTVSSSSSAGNTSSSIRKVSSSAGKVSSTTPSAATTSKAGTSSSSSQAPGKLSTQITPTGVTTVTYVATATGIAGFSFVTGAINAVPSQNIINYWISDTDPNAKSPQVSCANHCSSDSSCKSFAVWAQQTWFNCVIYSVATTTSTLETSNMKTLDDGSISSAIIFNKGKDTNLSLKYSFENPKCGMKGYLWNSNAFPDSGLDDIDDIVTCANYCKSQSGCLTYEWQPSIQRCQTWNKDMFAAGYLTYDPTSTTFWYDLKCDLSNALSPTFRNTRLTADQKTKYCGIKGNYNSAASDNTYKVYNVEYD